MVHPCPSQDQRARVCPHRHAERQARLDQEHCQELCGPVRGVPRCRPIHKEPALVAEEVAALEEIKTRFAEVIRISTDVEGHLPEDLSRRVKLRVNAHGRLIVELRRANWLYHSHTGAGNVQDVVIYELEVRSASTGDARVEMEELARRITQTLAVTEAGFTHAVHFGKPGEVLSILKTKLLAVPRSAGATLAAAWVSLGWSVCKEHATAWWTSAMERGASEPQDQPDDDGVPLADVAPSNPEARRSHTPEFSRDALRDLLAAWSVKANFLEALLGALSIKDNTDLVRQEKLAVLKAANLKRQEAAKTWGPDYKCINLSTTQGAINVGLVWRKSVADVVKAVERGGDHRRGMSLGEGPSNAADDGRVFATLETFAGVAPGDAWMRRFSLALHALKARAREMNTRNDEWRGSPVGVVVAKRLPPAAGAYAKAREGAAAFHAALCEPGVLEALRSKPSWRKYAWPTAADLMGGS